MADEEVVSTGSEAGAGANTEQQAADQTSQGADQSQSSEGTRVDSTSTDASSISKPGRSNQGWANQRLLEKTVKQVLQSSLQEHLSPYLEELKRSAAPQAPKQDQAQDLPDFNDLPGWVNRRVNQLLEERLKAELPTRLNQFTGQLEGKLKSQSQMQEARNYLISQKDIGRDQTKMDELRKVMEDYQIDVAADPVRAAEVAVKLWRNERTNPNAPPKATLTTIAGGTGGVAGKKELSLQEIRDLTNKLVAGGTMEDQEKLGQQIDSLAFPK